MNPDSATSDGAIQGSSASRVGTFLCAGAEGVWGGVGAVPPGTKACWCNCISSSKNARVFAGG